jgi:hypothetical protein
METKYNELTKMLESKYFSFSFPNLSPMDIEELKSSIMTEMTYSYTDEDTLYNFTTIKNVINLIVITSNFKVTFCIDLKTFLFQLDKIAENYQESECGTDSSDDSDDDSDSDSEDDSDDSTNE